MDPQVVSSVVPHASKMMNVQSAVGLLVFGIAGLTVGGLLFFAATLLLSAVTVLGVVLGVLGLLGAKLLLSCLALAVQRAFQSGVVDPSGLARAVDGMVAPALALELEAQRSPAQSGTFRAVPWKVISLLPPARPSAIPPLVQPAAAAPMPPMPLAMPSLATAAAAAVSASVAQAAVVARASVVPPETEQRVA